MSNESSQVVVAFDFSDGGRAALHRAVDLASHSPFQIVHFACILPPSRHVDIVYVDHVREAAAALIEQELRAAGVYGCLHFHIHVHVARNAAKEIGEIASEVGADLIVAGPEHADRLVRRARCTVVIARPKEYEDVPHEDVVEVEKQPGDYESHHYGYDDQRATQRPSDWPIY